MGILLQHKVLVGYLILPVIIGSMIAVFFREHSKIAGIEDAAHEIHHVRSDINRAHLQITLLSTSGSQRWHGMTGILLLIKVFGQKRTGSCLS